MRVAPSPYLVMSMALLAAGTILLLFAITYPQPAPPSVPPTPTLVHQTTIVPLVDLTAGPPRPHVTQTPRGR